MILYSSSNETQVILKILFCSLKNTDNIVEASQQGDVWIGTHSSRHLQLKALEGLVSSCCLQGEAGRGLFLLFLQPSVQPSGSIALGGATPLFCLADS